MFDDGVAKSATHMLIVERHHGKDWAARSPLYVEPTADVYEVVQTFTLDRTARIIEIYDLSADKDSQLGVPMCWSLGPRKVEPTDPCATFVREDRDAVKATVDGMNDMILFAEAMLLMEKYGLSVTFDEAAIEWEAFDPRGLFRARSNTPTGAVLFWECKREDACKTG